MPSLVAQTRDQVVAAIAAAVAAETLVPSLTPVAYYDVRFKLPDLSAGRMVVVPADRKSSLLTRGGGTTDDVLIDVAVQYHFDAPDAATLDPFMSLAESLLDFFFGVALPNGMTCVGTEFKHLFVDELLQKSNVFTSVVTLTFRGAH